MKFTSTIYLAAFALSVLRAGSDAQETPQVAIHPAVEVTLPTQSGFNYQLFSSPDLFSFTPTGPVIRGNGANQSRFFRIGGQQQFFRAERTPATVESLIPGLVSLSMDSAHTKPLPDGVVISGVRAVSSLYDANDYLRITYQLDLSTQCLQPVAVKAFPDVGITTSGEPLFFIADKPGPVVLTEAGVNVLSGASITVGATPRILKASMSKSQILAWIMNVTSGSVNARVTSPGGEVLLNGGVTGRFYQPPVPAFEDGEYTLEFTNTAATASTFILNYKNANQRTTSVLNRAGGTFAASVTDFLYDYHKFSIQLNGGESLTASGNFGGARLDLFGETGRLLASRVSSGSFSLTFTAPQTGVYYLIYYQEAFTAKSTTFTYSVTP